ncbi:MAG TPA: hypothetical protein VGX23_06485 [Actinocrinis sp.]|nr:hypothetical protein [Actinocrinis sp.]
MLTIIETTEFALASTAVAAACPPPSILPEGMWQPVLKQESGLKPAVGQGLASGGGRGISVSGPAGSAEAPGYAERAAAQAANGAVDLLHRPFYTMSRRDHRTWRPPH